FFFFFQAEDGIRDFHVTGVQTCALPISRYADRSFGTIDNSDPISQTYQGFAGYFVADARVRYKLDENWNVSFGVDNLNNDKYFRSEERRVGKECRFRWEVGSGKKSRDKE